MSKKGGAGAPAPVPGPSVEEDRLRLDHAIKEVGDANVQLKVLLVAAERRAEAADAARQRATEEASEYSKFAGKEIASRDAEVRMLRAALDDARSSGASALSSAVASATEERMSLVASTGTREAELSRSLQDATIRAESFIHFAETKAADDARIAQLESTLASERAASADAYATLEREFIEAKLGSARAAERMRSAMMTEAMEMALSSMDATQQRVMADNREMAKELTKTSVEARAAAVRLTAIAEQRTAIARKAADAEVENEAWVNRCGVQAKALKSLEARADALAAELADERAARKAEVASLLARFERESEGARAELAGLNELVGLKNAELRTVKRLAAIVLEQRAEVEQYFVDALADVKLEISKRKAAVAASATNAASLRPAAASNTASLSRPALPRFISVDTSMPASLRVRGAQQLGGSSATAASHSSALGTTATTTTTTGGAGSIDLRKVHVSELSAEEREQVLRILLAKIRGGALPAAAVDADGSSSRTDPQESERDAPHGGRVPFGIGIDT